MAREVFISYVEEDQLLAQQVCEALETGREELCWLAFRDGVFGGNFRLQISEQIEQCQVLVVLHSVRALDSEWVPREVSHALELRKRVLPVVIDGSVLGRELDLLLSGVLRLTLHTDRLAEGIEELSDSVQSWLEAMRSGKPPKPRSRGSRLRATPFDEVIVEMKKRQAAALKHRPSSNPSGSDVPEIETPHPEPASLVRSQIEIDRIFARLRSGIRAIPPSPVPSPDASAPPALEGNPAPVSVGPAGSPTAPARAKLDRRVLGLLLFICALFLILGLYLSSLSSH